LDYTQKKRKSAGLIAKGGVPLLRDGWRFYQVVSLLPGDEPAVDLLNLTADLYGIYRLRSAIFDHYL